MYLSKDQMQSCNLFAFFAMKNVQAIKGFNTEVLRSIKAQKNLHSYLLYRRDHAGLMHIAGNKDNKNVTKM